MKKSRRTSAPTFQNAGNDTSRVSKRLLSPLNDFMSRNILDTRNSRISRATEVLRSVTHRSTRLPHTRNRSNLFQELLQYSLNPMAVILSAASAMNTHVKPRLNVSFISVHSSGSPCHPADMTSTEAHMAVMMNLSNFLSDTTWYGILRNHCVGGGSLLRGCMRSTLLHISAHSFCSSVRSMDEVCESILILLNW